MSVTGTHGSFPNKGGEASEQVMFSRDIWSLSSGKGNTVRKTLLRACGLGLLFALALLGNTLGFAGTASAQSTRTSAAHTRTMAASCATLEVHLYGALPAKTTCLSSTPSRPVSPHTSQANCSNPAALWLYWDANESGSMICFIGSGFVNLTGSYVWCYVVCYSWNDQASSFYTGCSPVNFWSDINTSGGSATVGPYTKGNFPREQVGNDALSSVELFSNCG
jgi:hypothetical protein